MFGTAKLIGIKHTQDNIGQDIDVENPHSVPVEDNSVGFKEFYAAGQQGFIPSMTLVTAGCNYKGEAKVDYKGKYDTAEKRYTIYRTYLRPDGKIELYCTIANGANNG